MKRSRSVKKQTRRYLLGGTLLLTLLLGSGALWFWWLLRPVSGSPRKVLVEIPPGSSALEVAQTLERRGLIRSAPVFLWYVSWRGDRHRLKAGRFRLAPNLSAAQVLDRLKRGDPAADDILVTIPEGFTLRQIAETLEAKGVVADRKAFLRLVQSKAPPLSAPFSLPEGGLEGYLYPDTYRFAPQSRPEQVAQAMLDRFVEAFYERHRAAILRSKHSLHEIVTIASLIEREARVPQDRAAIAGVIENRLQRGMRLQIDATVLHALGRHKERVLYKDLATESPFNTYRHAGLPPGPIACPGAASLEAALNPQRHDYLYYVAAPDGTHRFTRTLTEHQQAVRQMRALRRRNRAHLPSETGAPL